VPEVPLCDVLYKKEELDLMQEEVVEKVEEVVKEVEKKPTITVTNQVTKLKPLV
jgi:hypothetical protein